MSDETAFSGPGKPDISTKGGRDVPVPVFFNRDTKAGEDEISIDTVETPREKAVRVDAAEALGQSNASAPKV